MLEDDVETLTAHFLTGFDANDPQLMMDNQPQADIDETQPWMRFSISPGASTTISWRPEPLQHQLGKATLQIFVPAGMGDPPAWELAEQFKSLFQNYRSADNALRVRDFDMKRFTDETSGALQLNVIASWESKRSS